MVFSQDERRKFIDDVGYDVVGHIDRFVEQGSVEFSFTEALNGLADEARTSLAGRSAPALLTCHGRIRLLLERAFVGGRSALFEE
jgi:hypothetical protein